MKYYLILEDNKGFTKTVKFEASRFSFPSVYRYNVPARQMANVGYSQPNDVLRNGSATISPAIPSLANLSDIFRDNSVLSSGVVTLPVEDEISVTTTSTSDLIDRYIRMTQPNRPLTSEDLDLDRARESLERLRESNRQVRPEEIAFFSVGRTQSIGDKRIRNYKQEV